MSDNTPRTDIGVGIFLIVVCSLVLWESRRIPPGVFEPLGSAPLPQGVASLIILISLVIIARAVLWLRRNPPPATVADDAEAQPKPLLAAAALGLTVVYVLVMALDLTSFAIATTVYLLVTISALTGFRLKAMPIALVIGLIMGYGCQYIFTRIFVIDLPV
jgi:putative tricarboxylic transport membrane protein